MEPNFLNSGCQYFCACNHTNDFQYFCNPQHDLNKNDSSEYAFDRFNKHWSADPEKKSLFVILVKCVGIKQIMKVYFYMLMQSLLMSISYVLLYYVLSEYRKVDDLNQIKLTIHMVGIVLCQSGHVLTEPRMFYECDMMNLTVKKTLIAAITNKLLHINPNQHDIGNIINLISSDITKIEQLFDYATAITPIYFICTIVFLLWYCYISSNLRFMILISLIIVIIIPAVYFGLQMGALRKDVSLLTDKRLKLINDMLKGWLVTKMFVYESIFYEMIKKVRKKEIKSYKKSKATYSIVATIMYSISPLLGIMILFIFYFTAAENGDFSHVGAAEIFPLLGFCALFLLGSTNSSLHAGRAISEFGKSQQRIITFLNAKEFKKNKGNDLNAVSSVSITILNAYFNWKRDDIGNGNVLKNICMHFDAPNLILIAGKIGSGKTALLDGIMNELNLLKGTLNVNGSLSYCPQQSFIFSNTIRFNILFGNEYDQNWYNKVIYSCGLVNDLNIFPNGDLTMIGDKGINLSGGQKTRLNLARCVYADKDILLLDDPLSAVDAVVANHIFDNLLDSKSGLLQNKLTILVTHQLQFAPKVNHIIILDNGTIIHQGNYQQMLAQQVQFDHYRDVQIDNEYNYNYNHNCAEKENKLLINIDDNNDDCKSGSDIDDCQPLLTDNYYSIVQEERAQTGIPTFDTFLELFALPYALEIFNNKFCKLTQMSFLIVLFVSTDLILLYSQYLVGRWFDENGIDIYLVVGVSMMPILLSYVRQRYITTTMLNASKILHNNMLHAVIYQPRQFFEQNTSGRILNRFSKDTYVMDDTLNESAAYMLWYLGSVSILVFLPFLYNIWLYIPLLLLLIVSCVIIFPINLRISLSLHRIESINRSFLYDHIAQIFLGIHVIRCLNKQSWIVEQIYTMIDDTIKPQYTMSVVRRNVYFWTKLGGLPLVVTTIAMMDKAVESPLLTALAIMSLFTFQLLFPTFLKRTTDTFIYMVATERIIEYGNLKKEANVTTVQVPIMFPENGSIEIRNVYAKYNNNLQYVLKDINLSIKAGSKVGIIGRTGSGKSSLFKCLFRLLELEKGGIFIDGIDINSMDLYKLRNIYSVIPQNPIIFKESIRYNLDPFDEYEDDKIIDILKDVNLYSKIVSLSDGIETVLSSSNDIDFSYGESQLLCLGRALLKCTKSNTILLIDEATSNVDNKTDEYIQNVLSHEFKNTTILCIAHRLNTIINYDYIISLRDGEIVEYDEPEKLLCKDPNNDANAILAKMYQEYTRNNL